MTVQELRIKFNKEFGLKSWPETYEVDADTYLNVCRYMINVQAKPIHDGFFSEIHLGKSYGILFKNVELILKD